MLPPSLYEKMEETVLYYSHMSAFNPNAPMIREIKAQYLDMSLGGDGGSLGYIPEGFDHVPTCREYSWDDYPNLFFVEVVKKMGW